MWQRSNTRLPASYILLAVSGLLLPANKAWPAPDPVDDLRQALTVRAEDRKGTPAILAYRDKILEEKVNALRTISDLRRALVEWKIDPDRFGRLQQLDEKWRKVVGLRLTKMITDASRAKHDNVRLAVANLIAELGPAIPALDAKDSSGYARSLTPIVIQLVHDRDLAVRQQALRALGTINAEPGKAVPIFGAVLKEQNHVGLRRIAADGLKRMVRVVTQLNKKLQTKSVEVWATSEELIQACKDVVEKIGAASRDGAGVKDRDTEVRTLCLEAIQATATAFSDLPGAYKRDEFPPSGRAPTEDELREIGLKYERVQNDIKEIAPLLHALAGQSAVLRHGLADPSPRVKLAAVTSLEQLSHIRLRLHQRLGSLPPLQGVPRPAVPRDYDSMLVSSWTAVPPLLEDLSTDLEARRRAIEYLENLGADGAPAIGAMRQALHDPDRFIRWAATRSISNLPADKAATAVSGMAGLLEDYDVDVRMAAAKALERLGPRAKGALEVLQERMLDKRSDPEFRVAVMYVVVSIGPDDTKSAVPLLIQALSDTDARVRRTAAEVLGKYGPLAQAAIPALRDALGDDDQDVRIRASDALLNILVTPAKTAPALP